MIGVEFGGTYAALYVSYAILTLPFIVSIPPSAPPSSVDMRGAQDHVNPGGGGGDVKNFPPSDTKPAEDHPKRIIPSPTSDTSRLETAAEFRYDGIVDILHIGTLRTSLSERYQVFVLRDNGMLSTQNGRLHLCMVGAEVVVNADVYSYRICERPRPRAPALYTTAQAPSMTQFEAWRKAFETVLRGTRVGDQYTVELSRPLSVGAHAILFPGYRMSPPARVVVKCVARIFPNDFRSFAITTISRALRDGILKNHHLAHVLDVYHTENETHVVMPRYGPALHRRLRVGEKWSENKVRDLFRQLVSALTVLHKAGFVHGCVVPSNVLIESENPLHVRLAGSCNATVPDPLDANEKGPVGISLADVKHALGHDAIQYMAPELVTMDPLKMSEATDYWALGVLMYRVLIGAEPFLVQKVGSYFGNTRVDGPLDVMRAYLDPFNQVDLLLPEDIKQQLSPDSISLLSLLVSPTPSRRYGDAVLQHPWCRDFSNT